MSIEQSNIGSLKQRKAIPGNDSLLKCSGSAQRVPLLQSRGSCRTRERYCPPQPASHHARFLWLKSLHQRFPRHYTRITLCKSRQRWLLRHALFLSTHQWFKEQRQKTLILMMPAHSRSRAGWASHPGGCWAEGGARQGQAAGPPRALQTAGTPTARRKGFTRDEKWI